MSIGLLTSVAEALIPPPCIEKITSSKPEKECENQMTILAIMIVNLLKGTIKNLERLKIRNFDANPGDGGCQLRAFILRELIVSSSILEEAQELKKRVEQITRPLHDRSAKNGDLKEKDASTAEFFSKTILPLKVSQEFLYVVHCHLLTVTKVIDRIEETGVVITKTDISKLSTLSKGIEKCDKDLRHQLIGDAAARISEESLKFIQGIKLSPLMKKMLLEVHHNKPYGNFKPKSFGCLFYEMKAILLHLREEKSPICIRSIVKEGLPEFLFLQPPATGQDFVFVEKVPENRPLIVFAGILESDFVEGVKKIGFTNLILGCTAQEAPFEPGSTVESIQDDEARLEILSFREKGNHLLFRLDHVYCSTLKEELLEKSYVNL